MGQAARAQMVVAVARGMGQRLAVPVVWRSVGKVRTVRRGQPRASLVVPAAVLQESALVAPLPAMGVVVWGVARRLPGQRSRIAVTAAMPPRWARVVL